MPIVVLLIGLFLYFYIRARRRLHARLKAIAALQGRYPAGQFFVGVDRSTILATDVSRPVILLGTADNHQEYGFAALAEVELIKNGSSISHTNRKSQLVGAAVGGALTGGAGLIVGGLSGSKRSAELVNEVVLKVIIDDADQPVHRVVFYRSRSGVKTTQLDAFSWWKNAERAHAMLVNAVRAASSTAVPAAAPTVAVEQRIAELWRLKTDGALSDDEYQTQKGLIIASDCAPPLGQSEFPA